MALISSINPTTRRIYLGLDSTTGPFDPIDIYKEMRTLRATDETLRPFDVFLEAYGRLPTTPGKFTEKGVRCMGGTRIVPYDADGIIEVIGAIISDDGQEGAGCFDKTGLVNAVDIHYKPPQVEIIEVSTSGVVTPGDIDALADGVWREQISDHDGVVGSTAEALSNISAGASPAAIAAAVWNTVMSNHKTAGTAGEIVNDIKSLAFHKGQTVAGTLLQGTFTTDLTETSLNHYKTQFLVFVTGVNAGASRPILNYATDGTIDVSPWFSEAPGAGDEFVIMAQTTTADVKQWNGVGVSGGIAGVPSVNATYVNTQVASDAVPDLVWKEQRSQQTDAGTMGEVVNDLRSLVWTKGTITNDVAAGMDQFESDVTIPVSIIDEALPGTIVFTSGVNAGRITSVRRYATVGLFEVYPYLNGIPSNGDTFYLVSASVAGDMRLVDGQPMWPNFGNYVWNVPRSSHDNTGSMGERMNDIGAMTPAKGSVVGSSSSTTAVYTDLTETTDMHYAGQLLVFTGGQLRGQVRNVIAYNGAGKWLIVRPELTEAPGDGDSFALVSHHWSVNTIAMNDSTLLDFKALDDYFDELIAKVKACLTELL